MSSIKLGSDWTCDCCGHVEHSESVYMPASFSNIYAGKKSENYVERYPTFNVCNGCWPSSGAYPVPDKEKTLVRKIMDLLKVKP